MSRITKLSSAFFAALVLASCSQEALKVTEEEFGDSWPFTVPSGAIFCDGPGAIFYTNDKAFALNGAANMQGYLTIDRISRSDPNSPMEKMPSAALLQKAIDFCGATPY
jgi:hypothetical protein